MSVNETEWAALVAGGGHSQYFPEEQYAILDDDLHDGGSGGNGTGADNRNKPIPSQSQCAESDRQAQGAVGRRSGLDGAVQRGSP